MPLFSYFCETNHETEWRGVFEERPQVVRCGTCGASAEHRYTVGKGFRARESSVLARNTGDTQPRDFRWCEVKCVDPSCGKVTVEDPPLGEAPEYRCEKCGGPTELAGLHMIDRFSERFPYFDRGLGCIVTSKQHRLEVCRQQGVVPVDGDVDLASAFRQRRAELEADQREYAAYVDKLEHDPAFAAWRRERDIEDRKTADRKTHGLPPDPD